MPGNVKTAAVCGGFSLGTKGTVLIVPFFCYADYM